MYTYRNPCGKTGKCGFLAHPSCAPLSALALQHGPCDPQQSPRQLQFSTQGPVRAQTNFSEEKRIRNLKGPNCPKWSIQFSSRAPSRLSYRWQASTRSRQEIVTYLRLLSRSSRSPLLPRVINKTRQADYTDVSSWTNEYAEPCRALPSVLFDVDQPSFPTQPSVANTRHLSAVPRSGTLLPFTLSILAPIAFPQTAMRSLLETVSVVTTTTFYQVYLRLCSNKAGMGARGTSPKKTQNWGPFPPRIRSPRRGHGCPSR
ncbi:hypothetical protein B0I37DRAFT_34699 [Chaetomium sp. MPI-CAGE-AT-0009]|nr:hypothetical protein B0I37DRAFT_34699 [Chaetomium sp. MPI-CAGE-AT-0009]